VDRTPPAFGRPRSTEVCSVSKRHHQSRRKSYGRRQHELRERYERRRAPERDDFGWHEPAGATGIDPFSFLDPRLPRLRFNPGN
jgi:hypothetical protein